MQTAALEGMKKQGLEGLTAMLSRQQEILASIAREKGDLRPFLDQWEGLPVAERSKLRAGRPGEILESLESIAQTIQVRHQEMFGGDAATGVAPASGAVATAPTDLAQRINLHRGLQ